MIPYTIQRQMNVTPMPIIIQFTTLNKRDVYSWLGYLWFWWLKRRKPKFVHVMVSPYQREYYSMSVDKGVYIDTNSYVDSEYVIYRECSSEYAARIISIFLYRKIKFSRYMTCISFCATCLGLHALEFQTADDFYEAITGLDCHVLD